MGFMNSLNVCFILIAFLFSCKFNLIAESSEENSSSSPSLCKKLRYELSLEYRKLTGEDEWWTQIEPFNIYLGALPLNNQGHLEKIKEMGVTRVLSMVEQFELEEGWFNSPVKAQDWEMCGIGVKHIEAVDFAPLTRENIERGVEYIACMLEEGHIVYVHCKAGRGRSAAVVIAYLMEYHQFSYDDAFAFVYNLRPQIHMNAAQRQAVVNYFAEGESETN